MSEQQETLPSAAELTLDFGLRQSSMAVCHDPYPQQHVLVGFPSHPKKSWKSSTIQ